LTVERSGVMNSNQQRFSQNYACLWLATSILAARSAVRASFVPFLIKRSRTWRVAVHHQAL
jgi:hypothetical protein